MRLTRASLFPYILTFYLVYSTINSFSIYSVGDIGNIVMVFLLCVVGYMIRPSITNSIIEARLFILGWGIVFLISILFNGTRPSIAQLTSFFFCSFYLCLNNEIQKLIFKKYVWLLSILIFLSAIEYVIFSITGKGVVLSIVTREQSQGDTNFYHLLFNCIAQNLFPRFQGLFKEPGNMGTTCAFMLFATWKIKSMKVPFFIFLMCGLLSLSLGYLVFLLIFILSSVKPNFKNIIVLLLITVPLGIIFKDSIEYRILERIDNADNIEDIDNRTTYLFDREFKKASESGELWLGVGSHNLPKSVSYDGGNAGAKKWIFQYGIIGLIIVFYIYNIIYYRRSGKHLNYRDWVFLFVFWICFYKSVVFTVPSLFVIYYIMPILNKQYIDKE